MTLTYRVDDTERHKTQVISYPEKTADIWRRYHWFSRQMTSEKRAQKFHTDDADYPYLGSSSDSTRLGRNADLRSCSVLRISVALCYCAVINDLVILQNSFYEIMDR